MRWLLHGSLAPAVAEALRRHGHQVEQLDTLPDSSIDLLKAAQSKQLDIITADAALVNDIFVNNFRFNRSIVFLQLEGGEVEQDDSVDRLFERYKRLAPGRLYTVTATRVKVRQLPGRT